MDVVPSYHGYIETNADALLLTQAVLDGKLNPVTRRPYEIERPQLIVSGNVFVFIEEKSGIKRWTDGVSWSPSRIMGKFLVYRELDKQNGSGTSSASGVGLVSPTSGGQRKWMDSLDMLDDQQRSIVSKALVGSLNSSYAFKPSGLVKKTMSIKLKRTSRAETIHIISYYTAEDVEAGKLMKPSNSPFFSQIDPCRELEIALENSSVGNSRNSCAQASVNVTPTRTVGTSTLGLKSYMSSGVSQPVIGPPVYQSMPHQIPSHHQHLTQQQLQSQTQQHQYFSMNYYPSLPQHSSQAQLCNRYSYCPQPNQNTRMKQQQQHQQHLHRQEQQQLQRPHSGSSVITTDLSQMTASSAATSAPQSHGNFSTGLPHPGTLFPSDQHKPTGIQLPLPFPHNPPSSGPSSAPSVTQARQTQPHSSISSAGSSSTPPSFVSYPGYNMQQYVQAHGMYPVSRFGVGSGTLPYASHMVGSSSSAVNTVEQPLFDYAPQQGKTHLGSSSSSNTNTTTGAGAANLVDEE
ncbi:HDL011Wp [Eremothecium sinecaudum]|uniref:HDL011Wp n=1 Tax=Eremothecium sinecaudum TaxID=45286 RepID=A0A120K284_9SACH|nr:HDL011Wp [Eremothecium sinecaudum]AMD20733.1 HDL011Wp [Eremothecium sinecaudum]